MAYLRSTLSHLVPKFIPIFKRKMTTVTESLVLTEVIGKVFLVGINRPEKRNCVNQATAQALFNAFSHFNEDDALRMAVLYGKGGNFCSGYDLIELSSFKKDVTVPSFSETEEGRGPMGPSRMEMKKPVIAAVSGYAVAGGLELACMCDMRVAETDAVFGVYCRRFGVPLIDGGTARLPQLVGLSRAMDMILTGRDVGAEEAFQMGLANRLVSTGTALGVATRLANTLADFPQECLNRDRMSAYYSCYEAKSLQDAFKYEHDNAMHVLQQESVRGAQSFSSGVGRGGTFSGGDNSKL